MNTRYRKNLFITLAASLGFSLNCFLQAGETCKENIVYRSTSTSGEIYNGRIDAENDSSVFNAERIERTEDPFDTRLFFTPTARTLSHGAVQMSGVYVFFPSVSIGLLDNFILTGGGSIVPFQTEPMLYVAPKLNVVHRRNLDLSAGAMHFFLPSESEESVGFIYLNSTIGSRGSALTVGVAWGYERNELRESAAYLLGGELCLAGHLKIQSEAWFLPAG